MAPEAIAAASADFGVCLERLWPEAAKRGVSRASYEKYALTLTPDMKIMEFMDSQPEFTKALWDYLDLLVTEARIARGREILAQYASIFDAVEKAYGVDRYIVTAIWGIESNFSTAGGERPVVRSTATLACIGRRQAYFRDEFLSALEILHRGDVRPEQLKGSWAGAFGPTQFMPTSFKRFAVDFDGDGRRDVVEFRAGPDRFHRQQPEEGRLGRGPDLGLRSHSAARLQLSAGRSLAPHDLARMGTARHPPHRRQAVPAPG